MNIVADEGVDKAIVLHLRKLGHKVDYVAEFESNSKDHLVLNRANSLRAVLVTTDKDFGELVFRQKQIHTGVVLLRFVGLTMDQKLGLIENAFSKHGDKMHSAFTVISKNRLRIRTA